jgi:hypothetical protein
MMIFLGPKNKLSRENAPAPSMATDANITIRRTILRSVAEVNTAIEPMLCRMPKTAATGVNNPARRNKPLAKPHMEKKTDQNANEGKYRISPNPSAHNIMPVAKRKSNSPTPGTPSGKVETISGTLSHLRPRILVIEIGVAMIVRFHDDESAPKNGRVHHGIERFFATTSAA